MSPTPVYIVNSPGPGINGLGFIFIFAESTAIGIYITVLLWGLTLPSHRHIHPVIVHPAIAIIIGFACFFGWTYLHQILPLSIPLTAISGLAWGFGAYKCANNLSNGDLIWNLVAVAIFGGLAAYAKVGYFKDPHRNG